MKVLHALVGYLAIISLPFHPFAFASPLALAANDYDGYVVSPQNHIDSALIEHIVETCQTVTTQNHNDTTSSALTKRVPGDIIEARQALPVAGVLAPTMIVIFAIVAFVTVSIVWEQDDDPKRKMYTQETVSNATSQYPKFNWVICHSPYTTAFDGVEGTDWGHTHHELGISFGRSIGYGFYWAKSGTFYRQGDGGFINWAYNGNITGTDDDGATVHFGTRY